MLRGILDKRLCTSGGNSHLDLTLRDALKISFPFFWTVIACCLFSFYVIDPIVHTRFPKTLPMYWTLISSLPAFMASLNLFVFHRDAVQQTGLSTAALAELSQVMRTISVIGVLAFIILAAASAVQAAACRYCDHDNYGESIAWCIVSFFWTAVMAWTTPTARHFSKLIFRFETQQQQRAGSIAIPTLCYTSTETGGSGTAGGGMHAFSMGRPGDASSTSGTAAGIAETAAFAGGYPLDAAAFAARPIVTADGIDASLAAAEHEYIRAAAGAPPTQVVAGRVSAKAEGKAAEQQ